jgi:hypothetical protein
MDKKHVFADGLELVTSLVFHKDGVIVAQAPDILWLRDKNGDGVCDMVEGSEKTTLFTGFGTFDIEGPGEGVGPSGAFGACEVFAGGVEGFGGYFFAGLDALLDGMFVEERPVVFFGREGEGEEEEEGEGFGHSGDRPPIYRFPGST